MDPSVCCSKLSPLFVLSLCHEGCYSLLLLAPQPMRVERKGLTSLALRALSLPLRLRFNHLCPLSLQEVGGGMGDGRCLLEQLVLASALLRHS